jgi:pyruvate/2-oxoglutarate dehydrogenase complex dihydrolipoamide dehydrogenase (E3) component
LSGQEAFDLLVLGGGSAGYAAARTAREFGATVAVIDQGPLGGLCILAGCMPSKALIASGEAAQSVRAAPRLGVETAPPRPNLPAILARKRELVDNFAAHRIEALKEFPLYRQEGRFFSPHEIVLADRTVLRGASIVIATGSNVVVPPIPGLAEVGFLDSDALLDEAVLPASMAVLGGGYVGAELGQYLFNVGIDVTMLIRSGHLLSGEDLDVGEALTAALREEGMRIEAGVRLERVEQGARGKKRIVFRRNGEEQAVEVDEILHALGREPRCSELDLEAAGVLCRQDGGIEVDATLRTSQPHIFAVGDVTGLHALVHVATHQGEIAARNALGGAAERVDYALQRSHVVFTNPQVGVAGETERALHSTGVPHLTAFYPFADHGKAMTLARTAGFVKIIAAPDDGRILGAAVVGPEGAELIHEMITAMYFRATVFDMLRIPHMHPTLSEIWTYPAEEIADTIANRTA